MKNARILFLLICTCIFCLGAKSDCNGSSSSYYSAGHYIGKHRVTVYSGGIIVREIECSDIWKESSTPAISITDLEGRDWYIAGTFIIECLD